MRLLITMNPERLRDAQTPGRHPERLPWGSLPRAAAGNWPGKLTDEPQRVGEPELKGRRCRRTADGAPLQRPVSPSHKPRSQREIVNCPTTWRNPGTRCCCNADNQGCNHYYGGHGGCSTPGQPGAEEGQAPYRCWRDPERAKVSHHAGSWPGAAEQVRQKLAHHHLGPASLPACSTRCAAWCVASRTSSATSWEGALQQRRSGAR